jgi:hypothetical protein
MTLHKRGDRFNKLFSIFGYILRQQYWNIQSYFNFAFKLNLYYLS